MAEAMIEQEKGEKLMQKLRVMLLALLLTVSVCGMAAAAPMIPQAQPGWFYSDADDHEFLVTDRIILLDDKDDFVKGVKHGGKERFFAVFVATEHTESGMAKARATLKRGGFTDKVLASYDSTMVGMLFRVDPAKPEELSYTVMSHQCLAKNGDVLYDWRGEEPQKASWTKAAESGQPLMFEKLWQKIKASRTDI